ncbi:MAG: 50S ribosomal protein L16 [Nanoarchaeota archaeon]
MAGLRKGHCYSKLERPYTRHSRVKSKSYIKTVPQIKIVRFEMGNNKKQFTHELNLISDIDHQIRQNALESARLAINRHLYQDLGLKEYYLKLNIYPYHVLRENKMLGGAHADRLQTGMAHSFGKTVNLSAQARRGTVVFRLKTDEQNLEKAKKILQLAPPKLPGKYAIEIRKI